MADSMSGSPDDDDTGHQKHRNKVVSSKASVVSDSNWVESKRVEMKCGRSRVEKGLRDFLNVSGVPSHYFTSLKPPFA